MRPTPARIAIAPLVLIAAALGAARAQEGPDDPFGGPIVPPPAPPPAAPASGTPRTADSASTTTVREALPGGAPEIQGYKDKVVFVLDRSGSMAIADRWLTALEVLEQLLLELPRGSNFDVYLADENAVSLFEGNWCKSMDVREQIRKRIKDAGWIDYGGFTDLVTPLKLATERRRPDAVYLLSDGVATLNEIDTEKIVAAVVKAATGVKIPIHTIAIGPGQDPAEDGGQAVATLKGIAEGTGGIYREVKSQKRPVLRAFRLNPPWAPPPFEDLARIHVKLNPSRETWSRQLPMNTDYIVEVEDPTLKNGPVALEYAEPKLVIRTFLPSGRPFLETKAIAVQRRGDRLIAANTICFVRPGSEAPPDQLNARGAIEVRCPDGGSAEIVYRRGGREFREAIVVTPPIPGQRQPGQ